MYTAPNLRVLAVVAVGCSEHVPESDRSWHAEKGKVDEGAVYCVVSVMLV